MSRCNIIFLSLLLLCGACSSDYFLIHNGNMPSKERISQIHKGQSKQDVMNILGAPSLITGLSDNHWIYMSSTTQKIAFLDPKEIDRQILAITFENDAISKIEEKTLADANPVIVDKSITKSTERKQGFFRKYFGGVGSYMPFGGNSNSNTGI